MNNIIYKVYSQLGFIGYLFIKDVSLPELTKFRSAQMILFETVESDNNISMKLVSAEDIIVPINKTDEQIQGELINRSIPNPREEIKPFIFEKFYI